MPKAATARPARPTPTPAQAAASDPLYVPLDFVFVRAPLLPIEAYHALSQGEGDAEGTAPEDEATIRNPQVRRAVAVGSTALLDALERGERGALTKRDAARLESRLLRHLIRMSTRPTPFGLFAGVALGEWGPQTDLAVEATAART